MPVIRINQLPNGSGSLSLDDVFPFMDDPSGSGTTMYGSVRDLLYSNFSVVTLPGSGTVNTNSSQGSVFDITVSGNVTLANPTNPVNGKTIRWRITQDSSGSHSITLGDKFNIPSSASNPLPWSTAANACDKLAAEYHAGRDKWDVVAFVPGY